MSPKPSVLAESGSFLGFTPTIFAETTFKAVVGIDRDILITAGHRDYRGIQDPLSLEMAMGG